VSYVWVYIGFFLLTTVGYVAYKRGVQRRHAVEYREAVEAGLVEPPSLHPVVDPVKCLGSGTCARVCPEDALGIVDGKAVLKNASACIGHGACAAACPFDAIQLVFGTKNRGIEIPNLSPEFETDVPGIFIAGELGGMGLIRKAAEQGKQAIDAIRKRPRGSFEHDVVIIGAGPAGISAGLSAIEHKLRYRLLEQEDSLGGAVFHYPRNKVAMTAPVQLALVGKVQFREVQKEKLLDFWNGVVAKTGLKISFRDCMTSIEPEGEGFVVHTTKAKYRTRSVLLALGRRGTPRKLGVPGEESSKVVYRLIDAEQYRGQAILVVGGGDSALEAAIALAEQPGTEVTLSYRSAAFSRVKQKNRNSLADMQQRGKLEVLLESTVESIADAEVALVHGGQTRRLRNDAVIVCAGGLLPTPLLQKIGIGFETKFGTR
jgi:thioredoxin reductase/ferredoxin